MMSAPWPCNEHIGKVLKCFLRAGIETFWKCKQKEMKKFLPILFIAILSCFAWYSQKPPEQAHIDSLLQKISVAKVDTSRLKLYLQVFYSCLDVNPSAALQYEKTAVTLADSINWPRELQNCIKSSGAFTGSLEILNKHWNIISMHWKFIKEWGIMGRWRKWMN